MIGSGRGRRRAPAFALAWVATTIGMLVAAPVPAHAADLQVSFTLTSLKVSGYKPTDVVTLQGTVRNDGDAPAYGVQAILWRSRDEIRDLATLRQAASSAVLGSRLPISPDHYVVVSTSNEGFAPGESAQVTLRATMADLGFDTRGVAFPFGADVIANADPGPVSDYRSVGQLRTFVAVPGKTKVPVTSVVLLTATPTKIVDNLFRSDSLAAELTGDLDQLLDAAARPGMGWLIDPALLDEVRDMADGYEVEAGGTATPGAGQDAAKAWLAKFDALDDDNGARTLFANPDVTGARAAKDTLAIVRSERAAAAVAGLDDLPLVVVPGQAQVSAATYQFIAESSADAVVATNTTVAGALQSGLGGQPKVLGASAAVPGSPETPPLQRRQFALATAVVAGAAGEVRLLRTPSDVEQDASAIGSWLVRRSLGELLESTASVNRLGLVPVKPAHLDADAFAELHRLDTDFTAYAELAPASLLTAQADAAVARATSSSFVGDPKGFDAQLDGLDRLVGGPALGRSVTLYASPRFVMSSKANQFPVTVTNKLTDEIRVKVVIDTDNRNRLNVPDTEVVEVEPGQSVTLNIRPEATSNGLVTARAHIATASGRRIGPDTAITVEVTDLGVVAWIIVGASGLVLVGATAWRIRQVRRRAAVAKTPEAGE